MRILVTLAVVLAAVGGGLEYVRQAALRPVSVAPSGPHPVGRVTDLWVDRARTDELAPLGGQPRMLAVSVWYPAAPGAAGPESPYAPGEWRRLHRFGWGVTAFDRVRTGTRDGVPPAAGPFPVVVLLPELGWAAPEYTAIAADLAAHGAVVVGVTPTYSARVTVLDGHAVRGSAAGGEQDRLLPVWAADARFAAGRAAAQFGAHVTAGRTVYVGHGFGGGAAGEACNADPGCLGAASLAGPSYESFKPALWLDAQAIAGAGPLAVTDYSAYHVAAPVRRALALGEADGRRVLEITSAYLAAFLATTTRGTPWVAPRFAEVRSPAMLAR